MNINFLIFKKNTKKSGYSHNTNIKRYFFLLISVIMSSAYANSQTADNSVDTSRIRVKENRKLETQQVAPNSDTLGFFDLIEFKICFSNQPVYRHEWNHYKDYMFGGCLMRDNVKDTYLLIVMSEIISTVLENSKTAEDLKISLKYKLSEAFFNTIHTRGYWDSFLLHILYYGMYKSESPLHYQDQLKYRTQDIIDDMYVVYFGEEKIDLKNYLSKDDMAKITETIMNNGTSKEIISIAECLLGYQQMTDSVKNLFLRNYKTTAKLLGYSK